MLSVFLPTASSSFNSSGSRSGSINYNEAHGYNDGGNTGISPFFEQWRQKNVPKENTNFLNWMSTTGSMMTIGDVEHAMKKNENPYGQLLCQQQQNRQNGNQSVPQVFQIASSSTRLGGGVYHNPFNAGTSTHIPMRQPNMPTQEQLQQHTSEIMRNAILRKQFNNTSSGRKFPK